MKIILKTESSNLIEIEFSDLSESVEKKLRESFDNRNVLKYELTFNDGVLLKDIHSIEDVTTKMINTLTVTLKD